MEDPDFFTDLIEGETNLLELMAALDASILDGWTPPPGASTMPTAACPPVWTCSTVIFWVPFPRWRLSASSNIAKVREGLLAWFKCSCRKDDVTYIALQGEPVVVRRGVVICNHLGRDHPFKRVSWPARA